MSVVLVTGGSGTFGRALVPILAGQGHQVRVLSRSPDRGTHVGDLSTGAGVAEAGAGAELVVHAATDNRLPGRTDLKQTRNLLRAIPDCGHLLYVSIVGVDRIPFGYYQAKLACEREIAASGIGSTILRATQFHELIARALRAAGRLPVAFLPLALQFQSVAVAEVAGRAAELLAGAPAGRAADFGGPQVLVGWQIAHIWRQWHPNPRLLLSVRLPGKAFRAFERGRATCPDHADGRQTWSQFVRSGGG